MLNGLKERSCTFLYTYVYRKNTASACKNNPDFRYNYASGNNGNKHETTTGSCTTTNYEGDDTFFAIPPNDWCQKIKDPFSKYRELTPEQKKRLDAMKQNCPVTCGRCNWADPASAMERYGPNARGCNLYNKVDHCDDYAGGWAMQSGDAGKAQAQASCNGMYGDPLVGYNHRCNKEVTKVEHCPDPYPSPCVYQWACDNGDRC